MLGSEPGMHVDFLGTPTSLFVSTQDETLSAQEKKWLTGFQFFGHVKHGVYVLGLQDGVLVQPFSRTTRKRTYFQK